jgi:membrane-associated phospholipid phosphatase
MPQGNSLGLRAGVRPTRTAGLRYVLAILAVVHPLSGAAQVHATDSVPQAFVIRWWHGVIVVGGLSLLTLLDEPAQRFFQEHRSSQSDDVAHAFRHFGQPEVFGTVTVGLVAAGLLGGNQEVARAGGRLAASLLVAGAVTGGLKLAIGRTRPNETLDAYEFHPFSGEDAMPSGHTSIAFALATSLADDIHRTWASVGLYTIATGVGWSRINDNKHWLSDVAAGAVVGVTSAKLVHGRWRIFNLRPPTVLVGPHHAGLAWQLSF